MWEKAESAWISRDGQDNYYRNRVVLPALLEKLADLSIESLNIIDIGSGDGYCINQLVHVLKRRDKGIIKITLVDRSESQLHVAITRGPSEKCSLLST